MSEGKRSRGVDDDGEGRVNDDGEISVASIEEAMDVTFPPEPTALRRSVLRSQALQQGLAQSYVSEQRIEAYLAAILDALESIEEQRGS